MVAYVLKRCAQALLVVWGAVTILFVLVRLAPGDPAILYAGDGATPEQIEAVRVQLGLDGSIGEQYVDFLWSAARFDFGKSITYGVPAIEIALQRLPASFALAGVAVALGVAIGLPLGVAAGRRPNSLADRVISGAAQAGQSLPSFWIGLMLILVFSANLRLLPSSGAATPLHWILPTVTLSLPFMAVMVRLARGGLLDVMEDPYILTARGKGLTERAIVYRTAVPNLLIPIVTVVGLQFGVLMGGAVVMETVFAWPGVGRLLVDSIATRDYALVQVVVALIAVGFVLLNLAVDLIYGVLDPRIRLGAKA